MYVPVLHHVPRILNKRVRLGPRIMVKLWVIFVSIIVFILLVVTIVFKIIRAPNTITTVIDLDMDETLLTKGQLNKLPIPMRSIGSDMDDVFQHGCRDTSNIDSHRENAAFIVLSRNGELGGVIKSMDSLEKHFNQWFNYPWVFLNDEAHSDHFKDTVKQHTNAKVSFGTIPKQEWDFPADVDGNEYREHIVNQGDRGIMYGQLESYHKMCRFYSKFFFKHDLVKDLEWYWRVEPNVEFYCDLTYDPFVEMLKHGKKYGFTVVIRELIDTVPNLFRYTKTFVREYGIKYGDAWKLFIKDLNFYEGEDKSLYKNIDNVPDLMNKMADEIKIRELMRVAQDGDDSSIDDGLLESLIEKSSLEGLPSVSKSLFEYEEYNLCHFWSNFEIARTDLFNNELYDQYIEFLEKSGGFYKERWGDAPIHSLLAGIFTNLSEIHYFRDIGYKHSTLGHCPNNNIDNNLPYKPLPNSPHQGPYKYDNPQINGVGCRCQCPLTTAEIENSGGSCMGQWINLTKNKPTTAKLDLDNIKISMTEKFQDYLSTGGDLLSWILSEKDMKELSKIRI